MVFLCSPLELCNLFEFQIPQELYDKPPGCFQYVKVRAEEDGDGACRRQVSESLILNPSLTEEMDSKAQWVVS